jgi:HSP20 family protein
MLPTITRRSSLFAPLGADWVARLRREVDELFDEFFGRGTARWSAEEFPVWAPTMNVREDKDALHVELELPGVERDQVQVVVENGVLTISGERKMPEALQKKDVTVHLREGVYGRFQRSFTLPAHVDAAHIRARYQSGVLEVILPKTEEAKAKPIPIETAP